MDLSHIHHEFSHIAALSDKERIEFMDQPRWIAYPQANAIIDMMHGLMQKPLRPRMPNLLITGDSNNGKTTIIRRFQSLFGKAHVNAEADAVIPIIVAESPPSADEKALYMMILDRFWTPYRATSPKDELRKQLIHLMRECHVRILVIDEFHSLLTGSPTKQREVMNAIKLLCNEICIPIVGVGTREAVRVLHTDPQHASRFDVVALPTWELNKEYQRLLAGFEKILPLKQPSKLHEPEKAMALHTISEGNFGNLHRLLVECAKEAIASGQEHIDRKIIESKSWLRPTRGIREVSL